MKEFALYKGEELLGIGTLQELAEQMKVTIDTLLYYRTPTYAKRTTETNGRRLVELKEEE